jgi:hypothetical protein
MSRHIIVWLMRLITLAFVCWTALTVFFLNPLNSKLYSQFDSSDWIWSWIANAGTVVLAVTLWWILQRFITRKIDNRKNA